MKILHLAVHHCLEDIIASLENRFSNWLMLKRVIALVLLYMKKLLESAETNKEPLPEVHKNCREKLIGLKEMQTAEMDIIKSVQSNYIVFLSKQEKFQANNRLFKLDLYIDAQVVLKVGGGI